MCCRLVPLCGVKCARIVPNGDYLHRLKVASRRRSIDRQTTMVNATPRCPRCAGDTDSGTKALVCEHIAPTSSELLKNHRFRVSGHALAPQTDQVDVCRALAVNH